MNKLLPIFIFIVSCTLLPFSEVKKADFVNELIKATERYETKWTFYSCLTSTDLYITNYKGTKIAIGAYKQDSSIRVCIYDPCCYNFVDTGIHSEYLRYTITRTLGGKRARIFTKGETNE